MNTKKLLIVIFTLILFSVIVIINKNNVLHNDSKSSNITAQGLNIRKYLGLTDKEYSSYLGKNITVAILDSGVKENEDINIKRIIYYKDYISAIDSPYDDNGHGTFVAGIIGANGVLKGIAPEVKFVILKVLDENGKTNRDILYEALNWVNKNATIYNIKIVNISIGVTAYLNYKEDPLCNIIEKIYKQGVNVVCSAGNKNETINSVEVQSPGISPYTITVGSSKTNNTYKLSDDEVASFSVNGIDNIGFTKPDLVAPGVDILSISGKSYITHSGTSLSCAVVTGALCILCEKYPNLDASDLKQILLTNTVAIKNESKINQGCGQLFFHKKGEQWMKIKTKIPIIILIIVVIYSLFLFFCGYRLTSAQAYKSNKLYDKEANILNIEKGNWYRIYLVNASDGIKTILTIKKGLLWKGNYSSYIYDDNIEDKIKTIAWINYVYDQNRQITFFAVKVKDSNIKYITTGVNSNLQTEYITKDIIIFKWDEAISINELNAVAYDKFDEPLYKYEYNPEAPNLTRIEDLKWYKCQ